MQQDQQGFSTTSLAKFWRVALDPHIPKSAVVHAVNTLSGMPAEARVAIADRAYIAQPNLFGSFVVLNRLGVSLEKMEFALDLFFVAFLAMEASPCDWPCISEAEQDRATARIKGMADFSDGLPSELQHKAAVQAIADLRERQIAAHALGRLAEWLRVAPAEESDKYVMLAVYSLIVCLSAANARKRTPVSTIERASQQNGYSLKR